MSASVVLRKGNLEYALPSKANGWLTTLLFLNATLADDTERLSYMKSSREEQGERAFFSEEDVLRVERSLPQYREGIADAKQKLQQLQVPSWVIQEALSFAHTQKGSNRRSLTSFIEQYAGREVADERVAR